MFVLCDLHRFWRPVTKMPSNHKYYGKGRTKKHKFCGNQFVDARKHARESNRPSVESDLTSSVVVEVKESSGATPTTSASKKISLFYAPRSSGGHRG